MQQRSNFILRYNTAVGFVLLALLVAHYFPLLALFPYGIGAALFFSITREALFE